MCCIKLTIFCWPEKIIESVHIGQKKTTRLVEKILKVVGFTEVLWCFAVLREAGTYSAIEISAAFVMLTGTG